MDKPFIAVEGQSFKSHSEWVNKATQRLTAHPDYNNTAHEGPKGYRGRHFTAMCFDQKGRRCYNGGDFKRADQEGTFPVWWVWPDQLAELIMPKASPPKSALAKAVEQARGGPAPPTEMQRF